MTDKSTAFIGTYFVFFPNLSFIDWCGRKEIHQMQHPPITVNIQSPKDDTKCGIVSYRSVSSEMVVIHQVSADGVFSVTMNFHWV